MSQEGALHFGGSGGPVVETLTGNSGGPVGPDATFNIDILGNTSTGITVVGNAGTHTLTIVAAQATTTQLGTIELATNAQAIAGSDPNNAITSASLSAKLGTQTAHGLPIGEGTSSAFTWTAAPTNGQILIGFSGADPVLNTITAGTGITIVNAPGSITISNTGIVTYAYTAVNTTPYVVLPGDQYISVDTTGGAITIELPNAPVTGRLFVIKDRLGTSAANPITVTTVGGVVLIDGAATYTINTNKESIELIFSGTAYEVF